MMTKEMAIQVLMDAAGHDLNKIKNAYEHGMLALEIAKTISATGVLLTELGGAVEETTAKAPEKKEELKGKPVSARENEAINDMLSVPNEAEKNAPATASLTLEDGTAIPADTPAPTMDDLQSSPAMFNMNPRAQVPGAVPAPKVQAAPTPAAPPAAEKTIDINSDEWKNKHLTPDEVDDTWTDRMKTNKEMLQAAQTLKKVCVDGINSGKIDPAWLDTCIKEASQGQFVDHNDRNIYNPPVVRLISAHVAYKVTELFRKAA